MDDVVVVLSTAPDVATAETIARALVDERIAACCTMLPRASSVYRWQGSVERAEEVVILIKTTAAHVPTLRDRIVELHPYELPEVIALPVSTGHEPYLAWVRESVGSP